MDFSRNPGRIPGEDGGESNSIAAKGSVPVEEQGGDGRWVRMVPRERLGHSSLGRHRDVVSVAPRIPLDRASANHHSPTQKTRQQTNVTIGHRRASPLVSQ